MLKELTKGARGEEEEEEGGMGTSSVTSSTK